MLKKINSTNLAFYFLPVSFILGPLILELILIYLSFLFIKETINQKSYKKNFNFFSLIFFSFSIYLLICLVLFSRYDDGFFYSLFYFRYCIYVLSIYFFLNKETNLLEKFLSVFLFVNFILIVDAIFQNYFGYNLIGLIQIDPYRVSSFFGDELVLGSFLSKISPLVFALAFVNKNKPKTILVFAIVLCALLNLYVISISGGRSSLFMYIFYLIFLFIFLKVNFYKKFFFISVISLILVSILLINQNVMERVVKKTFFEFTGKSISDKKDPYDTDDFHQLEKLPIFIFSPAHTNYYVASIKIFNDHKVFGAGPKSFRKLCKDKRYSYGKYTCTTHPHNYYIQLLAETGLLGVSFLITSYLSLLFLFYKNLFNSDISPNKRNFKMILIGALLVNYFPLMPTGNFFNNWNSILILLPVPILLWSLYDRK